ncbi:hypothetical protein F5Y12DRAFT_714099 [Xylaria sp. FL1777]|nr:hypothetical protein F5Y12DRAFT_714099 [Xylaria sp. FL1777]
MPIGTLRSYWGIQLTLFIWVNKASSPLGHAVLLALDDKYHLHASAQPEIRHHGSRTEDVSAGDGQKDRQGAFEVQHLPRLCLIYADVRLLSEINVSLHSVPNHYSRLVKEAVIDSKQAGERNVSAKSIRKATPVCLTLAYDFTYD